ncbi:MAG TPA: YjbH domain-containing protein [Lunatimonas sp.]|nr:YjbH domain-containing protein [Lunatimonas sp.]
MRKNKGLAVFIFYILFLQALAQGPPSSLIQDLQKAGFEQIRIFENEKDTVIFFENRNFRDPLVAFKYIQKIEEENAYSFKGYVPLYLGNTIGHYGTEKLEYRPLLGDEKKLFQEIKDFSQAYRFNFRILPDFQARFGNFDRPIESKTNLILDSRFYIMKGLSLQTGILFPLYNNLDNQDNNIRLSPTHLNYFGQFLPYHFIHVASGLFFNDRYGVDVSYRYSPLSSRWSLGMNFGYTGFYFIPKSGFYTTSLQDIIGLVDVAYFIPKFNSTVQITGGQFLAQDKGIRFDFIRQYGSIDIGFFATKTELGTTAGFQFAFPLFPGKIIRTNKFELRTTEIFRWEYSYSNEGPIGTRYRTGIERLDAGLRQYNSGFLKNRW